MAISKQQVKDWMARDLDDSDTIKSMPIGKVKSRVRKLQPRPKFHTTPRDHQWRCFLLGAQFDGFVYLLDMGLGKTKLLLDLFAWRIARGDIERGLVLVPGVSNVGEWVEQVEIHQPGLRVLGLDTTTYGMRDELFTEDIPHDLLVVTYTGWQSLVCERPTDKRKKGLVVNEKKANHLESMYGMVACDESTEIKNHAALPTKLVMRLSKSSAVYCLTGTPMDKNPQDFWSQFRVCDRGGTLGKHLNIFRAGFFSAKAAYWHRGFDYTFKDSMMDKLRRMMRHRSIRYELDECADIPEATEVVVPVILPKENWRYYERLQDEYDSAKDDRRLVESLYQRMRQLAAGYLTIKSEETADHTVVFKENPKLDALVEKLREIPEGEKVVVFCVHHKTGELISERLKKEKITSVRLYGETKDKATVAKKWKTSKTRVIICSKTGSKGLNLQVARYMITVEQFDSAIDHEQSRRRIRRMGQNRKTVYYDIVARGTVDEKIRQAVKAGRSLLEDLVDGKETLEDE